MRRQATYTPQRGDFIWMDFDPSAGHEQGGRRPALVLSPTIYNRTRGLAVCCPTTTKIKGYVFEALIPDGLAVSGVVLCDHIKNQDYQARNAAFICAAPDTLIAEVLAKARALL